jgi:prevent-host-death family protein
MAILGATMKTVPATEFKARCLALLGDVVNDREPLIVTRHGKPVVRVVPYTEEAAGDNPLKGSIVFETDLIEPIDEDWDALR